MRGTSPRWRRNRGGQALEGLTGQRYQLSAKERMSFNSTPELEPFLRGEELPGLCLFATGKVNSCAHGPVGRTGGHISPGPLLTWHFWGCLHGTVTPSPAAGPWSVLSASTSLGRCHQLDLWSPPSPCLAHSAKTSLLTQAGPEVKVNQNRTHTSDSHPFSTAKIS